MNEAIIVIFTGKSLSRAYLKRGKPFIFSPQYKPVRADSFCDGICFCMDIRLLKRDGFMSEKLLQVRSLPYRRILCHADHLLRHQDPPGGRHPAGVTPQTADRGRIPPGCAIISGSYRTAAPRCADKAPKTTICSVSLFLRPTEDPFHNFPLP
jgi:hypothetical protein